MICKFCGGSIPQGSGKCPECGTRINLADGGQTFYDNIELDEWEVSTPAVKAAAPKAAMPVSGKGAPASKKKKKGMSGNKFILICIAGVLALMLVIFGSIVLFSDDKKDEGADGAEVTCENCYGTDHKTEECPHKVNTVVSGGGGDPKAPDQKDPPSKGGEAPGSGRTDNDIFNKLPSRNEKTESNVCGICGQETHVRKEHPCKECDKKGHEGNCKDACQICGYDMHKTEDHPKCGNCGSQNHELCCSYCYKNHGKVRTDHTEENCPAKQEAKKKAEAEAKKKAEAEKKAEADKQKNDTKKENNKKETTTNKKQTTTTNKKESTTTTKPATTTPKQEAPKQEAPKQEAPKQEAPKQEDPEMTCICGIKEDKDGNGKCDLCAE